LKVIFLGTGTSQGVPIIGCNCEVCLSVDFRDKRLRTSVYIETEKVKLVIDTGPDFRQQMLQNRLSDMDAILFTHEHKDHVAGLDDIRPINYLQNKELPIYGSEQVIQHLKAEFAYIFAEKKYPGIPQVSINLINLQPFEVNGERIIPIQVMHHKMPVLGFRIRNFTYITDANYIAPEELEKVKGSDVVVLNGLQIKHHISHFTLEDAKAVLTQIGSPKNYLTHISHHLGRHAQVESELPDSIKLAFDGLSLEL